MQEQLYCAEIQQWLVLGLLEKLERSISIASVTPTTQNVESNVWASGEVRQEYFHCICYTNHAEC
jgi:hypothetical protein